ncbi:unnamed protein product [Mytilus edulis]|uniref:Cadherin domain-containing protein n=1 Tax=Mytilus edulis TaxID=6550 RepID=A0A8S3PSD8_MYTED|nr:unnamed protein product [Mytilus edulis]
MTKSVALLSRNTTICINCPSPYPCTTISFGSYETFIRNIPEDTPVGSVIGILDTYGTENEITLQPINNANLRLELPSRNITLQQQLDTDKGSSSLSLRIRCTPKTEPSSTVTVTIRVLLVDVNDHAPTFSQDQYTVNISEFQRYNVTLSESTPVSTIVKSLHPTGQKKDSTLSYSIMENQNIFIIQSSGDIVLGKALDYEQLQYYKITVTVTDGQDVSNEVRHYYGIDKYIYL